MSDYIPAPGGVDNVCVPFDSIQIALHALDAATAILRRLVKPQAPVSITAPDNDAPLPEPLITEQFSGVSVGWLRSHVVAVGRGTRRIRMYRPSDVKAALEAAPIMPHSRSHHVDISDGDEIDAMLANGELVRGDL